MQPAVPLTDVSWASKTHSEIHDIADEDGSILIVPVGGLEQHGHHLPTATDTVLTNAVAQSGAQWVADRVPVLVTPPVWSGYSSQHLPSFGATISVDLDDLLDTLEDIARSAFDNGFDALLFLNGHSGNIGLLESAVFTVGDEHLDRNVFGLTYFHLLEDSIGEMRDSDIGGIGHAGEFETSLMLHLPPDLVNEDEMHGENLDPEYSLVNNDMLQERGPLLRYRTSDEYSESGAQGDPGVASAEKGAEFLKRLGDEMEALLVEIYKAETAETTA